MPEEIVLGTGVLSWDRHERVNDRYGGVMLMADAPARPLASLMMEPDPPATDFADAPVGQVGTLVAVVEDCRPSHHIGDLYRGFSPRPRAKTGARLVLGHGTLGREEADGYVQVTLRPRERRTKDWLNPRHLYALHESLVRLLFVPDSSAPVPPIRRKVDGP